MIYELVDFEADIRQGDIFRNLPRIDLSLMKLPVVDAADTSEATWSQLIDEGRTEIAAVVGLRPVSAIVITQDCDTLRADQITLCQISAFAEVLGITPPEEDKAGKWYRLLIEQSKKNLKWFYLPPDPAVGIITRMAVDFQVTLSVPRIDLETLRSSRICRLNSVADEHFRERLSEFFRRYPVDEWYPFSAAELAEYSKNNPDIKPKPWQHGPAHGLSAGEEGKAAS